MYDTTPGLFFTVLPFGKFHIFLIEHSQRGVRDIKSGSQPPAIFFIGKGHKKERFGSAAKSLKKEEISKDFL